MKLSPSAIALLIAAQTATPAMAQTAAQPSTSTWITLGTGGGPMIRQKRSEPANALVVGDAVYLFDCGEGTLRRLAAAGLPVNRIRAIFISHHHIDHNAGLGAVLDYSGQADRKVALPIYGPPGTKDMVKALLAAGHPAELAPTVQDGRAKGPLASSATGFDMPLATPAPVEVYRDANIRVLAVINTHYHFPPGSEQARVSRSYALRIETAQRSIVYTGDTGPSAPVTAMAKGADMLVSEVMDPVAMEAVAERSKTLDKPAFMRHMMEDHLTPEEIGKMATAAGVKQVVLTHIVPGFDRDTTTAPYSDGVKGAFSGSVTVASDLDHF